MAFSLKGLEGPGEVSLQGGGAMAGIPSGKGVAPVTWGVGNPLAAAVGGFAKEWKKFADEQDEMAVNDFRLDVSRRLQEKYLNPESGEFNVRKGEKAAGMYDEGNSFFEKIWREEAPKRLNSGQMQKAYGQFATLFSDWGRKVAAHESGSILDARKQAVESGIFEAQNLIVSSGGDPDIIADQTAQIADRKAQLGRLSGWSEEKIKMETEQARGEALVKSAITTAAQNPGYALNMLKANKGIIPPIMYGPALHTIEQQVRAGQERARAEQERAESVQAANIAYNFVRDETLRNNPLKMREELESKFKGDPKLLAKMESVVIQNMNLWQSFEAEQKQADITGERNALTERIKNEMPENPEDRVSFINNVLAGVANPENMSLLERTARQAAGLPVRQVTDPIALQRAISFVEDGGNLEDAMTNFGASISDNDFQTKVVERFENVERRNAGRLDDKLFNEFKAKSGMKTTGNDEDAEKNRGYLAQVQSDFQEWRLSPEGIRAGRKEMEAWLYSRFSGGTDTNWWDTGINARELAEDPDNASYVGVPKQYLTMVDRHLEIRGLPPTRFNRERMWQNIRDGQSGRVLLR